MRPSVLPTWAFGSFSVRRHRSTTVLPRQTSEPQSISTCRCSVSTRSGGRRARAPRRRGSASRRTRTSGSGSGCRTPRARRRACPCGPSRAGGRRRRGHQRLVRHVEADHRDVEPAFEDPAAASGSAQMLNSAAGVTFPSRSSRPSARSARDAHRVAGEHQPRWSAGRPPRGGAVGVAARKSTACSSSGEPCAGGRSGPSRPVSPWTYLAT